VDKEDTAEKSERKIKVGDTEVKVKNPPPSKVRPEYRCIHCNILFPSELDLIEHKKINHNKKTGITD
jgi:hypothetical protein